MDDKRGNLVSATRTSLRILEMVKREEGMRLADLAAELDLAKSTIHNHLSTLEAEGYVINDEGTYQLGLKLFNLGEMARRRDPAFAMVREPVQACLEEFNGEADFTVEEHGRLISIYHASGDPTGADYQTGLSFYMHTTSGGKALLAEYPRERVEAIIDQWGLPSRTDQTITDRDRLFAELQKIRDRGYAINDQETMEGFTAVSKPAFYPDGSVFGSLTIGGASYKVRSEEERLAAVLDDVIEDLEEALEAEQPPGGDWWQPLRE